MVLLLLLSSWCCYNSNRAPGTGHRAMGTGHRAPSTGHRHRAPGTRHRALDISINYNVNNNKNAANNNVGVALVAVFVDFMNNNCILRILIEKLLIIVCFCSCCRCG